MSTAEPKQTYASYLHIDGLLAQQHPRTGEHDELLFIVIHQVYELWFKQLLHELGALQRGLVAGDTAAALGTLRRIGAILKTIVAQVDVLETLTPQGFASFRAGLDSASGFQSAQFRELEAVLGRRDEAMLAPHAPGGADHTRIRAAMDAPDVFASLLAFLQARGHRDVDREDAEAVGDLLVEVHGGDGDAALVCEGLVDLDEGMQEWRYRHVQMVRRMIGDRPGTGGSSGAEHLKRTLLTPVFPALWAIRSRL